MPGKNALKTYVENSFYHVYNRGVEKRNIFLDEQDDKVFLSYLKLYLTSKDDSIIEIKKRTDLSDDQKNEKIDQRKREKLKEMPVFYKKNWEKEILSILKKQVQTLVQRQVREVSDHE